MNENIVIIYIVILAFSLFSGYTCILCLKKQMSNIESNKLVIDRIKKGTFKITNSRDSFLYSRVTKVALPQNNNSSNRR